MTVYRLSSEQVKAILTDPRMYAELPVDLSWVPVQQIPDAMTHVDYELKRFEGPAGSVLGEYAVGVATTMEETTRNILSLRYRLDFNKHELAMSTRASIDVVANSVRVAMRQMNLTIAQLVFQGSAARHRVAINGMFDLGEDVDAGLDDDYWDTAGEPIEHVKEGVKDLIANNYAPPYTIIMSYDLLPGFKSKHNAAVDTSAEEMVRNAGFIDRAVYAAGGTDTGNVIYPLPAAANDDGVWIMTKPSADNYFIGQVTNGIEASPMEFHRENNSYSIYLEWRGTFVVRDGASIVYEPDVDLVA